MQLDQTKRTCMQPGIIMRNHAITSTLLQQRAFKSINKRVYACNCITAREDRFGREKQEKQEKQKNER